MSISTNLLGAWARHICTGIVCAGISRQATDTTVFAEGLSSAGIFDTTSLLTNRSHRTDFVMTGVGYTFAIDTLLIVCAGDSGTGFDTFSVG